MFHARISLRRSVLLFDPPFDHLPRDYYLVQCARSLLPINSRQQGEQRSPFELASRLRVIRSVTVSSFRVSNPARLEPTTLPVLQHAFHHYPPLEFRGAESFGRKLRFYRFLHVEIELLETKKNVIIDQQREMKRSDRDYSRIFDSISTRMRNFFFFSGNEVQGSNRIIRYSDKTRCQID